jgi:hypothetical protein
MSANRSQRCFLFFSAQRAFAISDKRLRPAAVMPRLDGFGGVCFATEFLALACGLTVFFRASHLARRASARRWLAFLRNHREAIAAMDFFTVPTVTFSLLYCFFVISHDRRRILHFNVTRHPTSRWIVQQLREAFPYQTSSRFLIFDHDAKYGLEVPAAIRSMSITRLQPSIQSPWQNGVAERWVSSCRRELLDHIIALNERHLRRLPSMAISRQ